MSNMSNRIFSKTGNIRRTVSTAGLIFAAVCLGVPPAAEEPGPGQETPRLDPVDIETRYRERVRGPRPGRGDVSESAGPGGSRITDTSRSGIGMILKPEPPEQAEEVQPPPAMPTAENEDINR